MKANYALRTLLIISIFILALGLTSSDNHDSKNSTNFPATVQQVALDGNNISSYIWNTGVIDQDLAHNNNPGFEWVKGTGKYAIFTAGLTIGAYVNNQLRFTTSSYKGENSPGYCVNGVFQTNSNFRLYKVTRSEGPAGQDWQNWGNMVPYGAPFVDANHNGIYEPSIDTPGIQGAAQTIFICMTDADPATHVNTEGFGGGTTPLGAELHMTAWCYDNPGYQDMQFVKWVVINKNNVAWDSTISAIVSDPDLGDAGDDYVGCDSLKNMAYCYNSDNQDGDGNGFSYGLNPPAVGIKFLCLAGSNLRLGSFAFFTNTSSPGPICERDPSTPVQAYWFMKGCKNDGTPFVIPNTTPPVQTKFTFPGDPETANGWTEYNGKINNCGGSLTGNLESPAAPGDRRFVMSTRNLSRMNPGDTQVVQICQLVGRGNSNKNSVTVLKQLSGVAQSLFDNGFVIGVTPISTEVPKDYALYQNYPNPFNPVTVIKFQVAEGNAYMRSVRITVYDAIGREVAVLVNEELRPGTYEVNWDASNSPSGVYFYKLESVDFTSTHKMILMK